MDRLFEISDLRCSYDKSSQDRKTVLEIKHLIIPKGHKVFIVGESGIGKSTILEVHPFHVLWGRRSRGYPGAVEEKQ